MDEIFNNNDKPEKIDLTPIQTYNEDPYFELEKQKKKHPKYRLNKHLNNTFNNDLIRKQKIIDRLQSKLNAKTAQNNT